MRRILSLLLLIPMAALVACGPPSHTPTWPRGYAGLRGMMNHLPDGRWQFVLEMPNPDRNRDYRVESREPLEIAVERDAPRSRAVWITSAARVDSGQPFQLKIWADGDDFPIEVGYPAGGRNYQREGVSALILLSISRR